MPLESEKAKKTLMQKVLSFFDEPSNFRLVFFVVLYCDIRYLSYPAYFSAVILMAVWSLGLIIRHFFVRHRIMRLKFRRIIFVFMLSAFVSVILHSEINLFSNLLTLYFIAVCFCLFYGIHAEKSNLRVKKELKRLFDVLVVLTNLTMLIGLVLFAIFPSGFSLMGFDFCIIEGRFVGIIPNANVTGFYSAMCIILCTMLLRMRRADRTITKKLRIWYISGIVLNALSLVLTDSNASMVFIIVYVSFLFFYELFKEFSLKKSPTFIFRVTAAVLACTVIVAAALFIRAGIQNGVSNMLVSRESDIVISKDLNADDDNLKLDKSEVSKDADSSKKILGHQNSNIDSGRFVLWRQALGLIELHPIFGIGKDNISDYGVEYLGGIRYTQLGDNKYVDFHNGLLTITVSFGLAGLSLFLVLTLTIAKAILKSMFRHKIRSRRDGNVLVLIAAFCTAYCVYSMFEAALFTDYTYRVYIFWLIVGSGLSYVMKYHQQGLHSKLDPEPLHDDSSEFEYIKKKFSGLPFFSRRSHPKTESEPETEPETKAESEPENETETSKT